MFTVLWQAQLTSEGATGFKRLIGAYVGAFVVDLSGGLLDFLVEGVLKPLIEEVSLLLRHPLLQTKVRPG